MNTQANRPFFAKNQSIVLYALFMPLLAIGLITSTSFIDEFSTPKELFLHIGAFSYTLLIALALLFTKRRARIAVSLADLGVSLFFAYNCLHILLSYAAFFDSAAFITLFSNLAIYAIVRILAKGENPLLFFKIFVPALFAFINYQVFYGYIQLWDFALPAMKNFKIGGSFGNPGPFSNYIVLSLPLALGVYLNWPRKSCFDRFIAKYGAVLFILILLLLPATKARTSWLAALAGITVLLWSYGPLRRYIQKIFRHVLLKIAFVAAVSAALSYAAYGLYQYKEDSAAGRLFTWVLTWDIIKAHPLSGTGFNTYVAEHNEKQAAFFSENGVDAPESLYADNIAFAFNEFLEIASELGVPGLLLFAFLFAVPFLMKMKNEDEYRHPLQTAFASAVAVFGVCALFSYPLHDFPSAMLFFVFLACLSNLSKPVYSISLHKYLIKAVSAFLLLAAIFVLNKAFKNLKAQKEWNRASLQVLQDPQKAFKIYEDVYPALCGNGYFLYNYGAELSNHKHYAKALEILQEARPKINDSDLYIYLGNSYEGLGKLKEAEKCFRKAWHLMPQKLYPQYRLVYIYEKIGRKERAIEIARHVLNQKVKVQSQITAGIRQEMLRYLEHTERSGLKMN